MGGAVFVSTALLHLAKEAAGCEPDDECDGRVYGMRPSSLLTNIVTVVGIICALTMPLVGAIIDHTSLRRDVGRITSALFTVAILLQLILLRIAWFGAAIAQVVLATCYSIHLVATYAYLPELTSNSDQLIKYTARFTAAQYGSSVVFLIFMVLVLTTFFVDATELQAAQVSQSIVFVMSIIFFGYAWVYCFADRPPSHRVPEGQTLVTVGFTKLFSTLRKISQHHDAIKWFLVSVALTEATSTAFSSIAITYMTDQLHLTSAENGIAILLLLLSGVPGTKIASFCTNRFNPIRSLQLCLLVWIAAIGSSAFVLRGPGNQMEAYGYAIIWGLSLGWMAPSEKVLYCTIIPKGQEAELMGVYICACQILSWLPPLVFSVMNENGISMRIGLLSLTSYFLLAFFTLFLVGDYEEAKEHCKLYDETSIDIKYEISFDGKKPPSTALA